MTVSTGEVVGTGRGVGVKVGGTEGVAVGLGVGEGVRVAAGVELGNHEIVTANMERWFTSAVRVRAAESMRVGRISQASIDSLNQSIARRLVSPSARAISSSA